jgi:hypothetical protein
VFEIPHQWRWIEEVNGCDTQTFVFHDIHRSLEYQHDVKDACSVSAKALGKG